MTRLLALLVCALGLGGAAQAQVAAPPPPVPTAVDSSGLPSPSGAVIRAVAVPGWGQVYAGQPLKAPFALAAVVGAAAYAVNRQQQYLLYRRATLYAGCVDFPDRVNFDEVCTPETLDATRDEWEELEQPDFARVSPIRDRARGQRDVAVLIVGVAYAVQALDAYVASQLAGFDVSEDLSLRVAPEAGGVALRVRL